MPADNYTMPTAQSSSFIIYGTLNANLNKTRPWGPKTQCSR